MIRYGFWLSIAVALALTTACATLGWNRANKERVPLDRLTVQMESFIKEEAELHGSHIRYLLPFDPPFEVIGQAPEDPSGRRKLISIMIWEQSMFGSDDFASKNVERLKEICRGESNETEDCIKRLLQRIEEAIDEFLDLRLELEGELLEYSPQLRKWVGERLLEPGDWVVRIRFIKEWEHGSNVFTTFAVLKSDGEVKMEYYSMTPPDDRWGH